MVVEAVTLRDRRQHRRHFAWKPGGFLLDGPAGDAAPAGAPPGRRRRRSPPPARSPAAAPARVAAASRIWVEGRHDAELVEHVWGDDLRELGIVVEPMHGIDDLVAAVAAFATVAAAAARRARRPPRRRVEGVPPGRGRSRDPHVLVTGHPFVDVWAGVQPRVLGLDRWPDVPRGPAVEGGHLPAPSAPTSPASGRRLRNRVRTYADLRPELVGAVEQLLDFVAPAA